MCTEGLRAEVEVRSSVVLQIKGNYGERKKEDLTTHERTGGEGAVC